MITKHPDSDYLMDYTTGSLSIAPMISVATHLHFCNKCSDKVDAFSNLGGELLSNTESVDVSDDLLDQVMNCLDEEPAATPVQTRELDSLADDLPEYLKRFLPDGDLPWRSQSPSIRVAPLPVGEDQFELALHRIKAGGKAPHHDHRGREWTVVLKGSFSDEEGVYREGDFIVRNPGDAHSPHATQHEECICLSVLEAPISLTGVKKVLNPFMRFSPS